jgi:allantoinase
MDEIIRGTIVAPHGLIERGWIGIEGRRIAAIGAGEAPAAARQFDAGGAYVIPGVVDGQTHAGSYRGLPGIESTTRSAIAGGVTTIVDMPYDNPTPLWDLDTFAAKKDAIARYAHSDVALYATIAPTQDVSAVAGLIAEGIVAFKISAFESSPTRFPRIPADKALDLLEALARTGIPLGIHNEDQEIVLSRMALARRQGANGIAAHATSRPLAAEQAATAHFLELGAMTGAHAHIVHLTSGRGFQLVDRYLAEGFRATGELCVHYLWFDAQLDGSELGARMKVNPPIRAGQIDTLWAELLADRVAFVSSDHSSWPIDNKQAASIFDAGAGVPGLETLLPAFYTGAAERALDAIGLTVRYLCERPARFFGLWPQKGALVPGADADIAVLSRAPMTWDETRAHDELNWSPFHGRRFACTVVRSYVGGKLAWDGQAIRNAPGDGRFVPRGTSAWFN